jgi:methylated-DNA-[protein]-cysteine S-methyltransferase
VGAKPFRYEAPGFGVGELWLDGDRVVWHELPTFGIAFAEWSGRAHPLAARLVSYFQGAAESFDDVELALEGLTPFYRRLAAVLRRVPRGQVVSYGELASLAGRPTAQRAAGSFCARNRHAIFVPCHRVVGADGLGSYGSFGLDYKRRLLALEGYAGRGEG